MIKLGIELNGVIRNINHQMCKYYAKGIDDNFTYDKLDEDNMNPRDVFRDKLDTEKKFREFVYIDYPYEIFGCAQAMQRGLSARFTNWLADIPNFEKETIEVSTYSLDEEALTIQSTYFFLSKFASRVRKMIFPESTEEVWDNFDVVITCNPNVIRSMPKDKKFILIERDNNIQFKDQAVASYKTMRELLDDETLLDKLTEAPVVKESTFTKFINKFKSYGRKAK